MPDQFTTTIFLTGATGFVGRHVLAHLLGRGYRVRCLIRPGREATLPHSDRVEAVPGDVVHEDQCRHAAEGASAAIHLVGIIREVGESTFHHIHIDGTRSVVDACRAAGVTRLVHMSAHGRLAASRSEYQLTKAAAEEIVRNSGLRWTIFRPSLILGADGEFLQQMVKLVRPHWRPIPVLGDGRYVVQPVAVDDVADLFVRSLEMTVTEEKTYSLGGLSPVTFNDFLDTLSRVVCGQVRPKVHLPMALARPMVRLAAALTAKAPITPEQLLMLGESEAVDLSAAAGDFAWHGTSLEQILRTYLDQGAQPD